MITQILEEAAAGFRQRLGVYAIATEADFDEMLDNAQLPAIVLINDFQTSETLTTSGVYQQSTYTVRIMFADKIEELDEVGTNIHSIYTNMLCLCREFFARMVRTKLYQNASDSTSLTYTTQTFEHLFDTDLAGVFASANIVLRVPINYCKYEC